MTSRNSVAEETTRPVASPTADSSLRAILTKVNETVPIAIVPASNKNATCLVAAEGCWPGVGITRSRR